MDKYLPPNKFLAIRALAMPKDTNPGGDIFGGWLMSQMDIGAASAAVATAKTRVATVAIESLHFLKPIYVGDEVSIYAEVQRIGRTSVHVKAEAWAKRHLLDDIVHVAEGIFVFVSIDNEYNPLEIKH